MTIKQIQEKLLVLLPHWNYRVIRPVKQLLDDGISLEMYYCLLTLREGGTMAMTEFAEYVQIPTHQMSKLSNKLFDQGLIERIYNPKDRRITQIKITAKAAEYMDHFLEQNASCFIDFIGKMNADEMERFGKSINDIWKIFSRIAHDEFENME